MTVSVPKEAIASGPSVNWKHVDGPLMTWAGHLHWLTWGERMNLCGTSCASYVTHTGTVLCMFQHVSACIHFFHIHRKRPFGLTFLAENGTQQAGHPSPPRGIHIVN